MSETLQTQQPDDTTRRQFETWVSNRWRPAMAWSYFAVCICDFIIFPVLSTLYQAWWHLPYHEWHPLTLQGGGLYHMAMGAIVGVTSWQRSQERIAMYRSETPYGGYGGYGEAYRERTTSMRPSVNQPEADGSRVRGGE